MILLAFQTKIREENMTIYRRIKDLADQKKISIHQIEVHFGFANGSMRKWTDNANPERLAKVAKYLGTTPGYLRGEEKAPADQGLTENQKLIAYSIDPDISNEERDAIIAMVEQAMKMRRRIWGVADLTDMEKIEDMYPQLRFWMIDVPNPHYHGSIIGKDVYVNSYQTDLDWLLTALHEAIHYETDSGDVTDVKQQAIMQNEGRTRRMAAIQYDQMFGPHVHLGRSTSS